MNDKNKNLFKIPNDIFCNNLSASEITVLSAVYSLRCKITNGKKYVKINQKAIATICGFKATQTISKAVDKLCRLGYIERIDRPFAAPHRLGTYVYTIPNIVGRYFYVNRNIFKHKLKPAQMRMYLFFCKCADSVSKSFWQSFNDICRLLKLQRSAVITTISELISVGLIKKHNVHKKDGSYSDNYYEIVDLELPAPKTQKKKRRCCFALNIFLAIFAYSKKAITKIVLHQQQKVNTFYYFFVLRGSPILLRSLNSTHFISNRKKKKIRLYLEYYSNLRLYERYILTLKGIIVINLSFTG